MITSFSHFTAIWTILLYYLNNHRPHLHLYWNSERLSFILGRLFCQCSINGPWSDAAASTCSCPCYGSPNASMRGILSPRGAQRSATNTRHLHLLLGRRFHFFAIFASIIVVIIVSPGRFFFTSFVFLLELHQFFTCLVFH